MEQMVNSFITDLLSLSNESNKNFSYNISTIGVTTKEEIHQNMKNAFSDMKAKVKRVETQMLISEILEKLNELKKEYNQIASNYCPVGYEDCEVNFGSIMWIEAYTEDREQSNPNGRTEEQIDQDHQRVRKIIEEADAILEEHKLTQFLLEETTAYWLGVYAEPYTSVY